MTRCCHGGGGGERGSTSLVLRGVPALLTCRFTYIQAYIYLSLNKLQLTFSTATVHMIFSLPRIAYRWCLAHAQLFRGRSVTPQF
jgi:hypothetical protein